MDEQTERWFTMLASMQDGDLRPLADAIKEEAEVRKEEVVVVELAKPQRVRRF